MEVLSAVNKNLDAEKNWSQSSEMADGHQSAKMETSGLYRISIALLLFVISIVTLAGNSITVYAVKKEKSLRSKTNYLVVSLACADLMVSLLIP